MPTIIDVAIEYVTPILGINPIDDLGIAYFEERIKKEIEKTEKKLSKVKDEEERQALEMRLERLQQELMSITSGEDDEFENKKVKVFLRNCEGALCWSHHQIKGHFKEIVQYRMAETWLRNAISRFVDIFPHGWNIEEGIRPYADLIPILRDGEPIKQPDTILSRPLASWVGTQRIVTISSSELIYPPAELMFRVVIWDIEKKDKIPTPEHIRKILSYGIQWGHSGWRTARYGRYVVKEFNVVGEEKKIKKIAIKKSG
jgi:hypothetical protein